MRRVVLAVGLMLLSGSAYAARVCGWTEEQYQCGSDSFCSTYVWECYDVSDTPPIPDGPPGSGMGGMMGPDGRPRYTCDPPNYYSGLPKCSCDKCLTRQQTCLDSNETDHAVCDEAGKLFAVGVCQLGINPDHSHFTPPTFRYCPGFCDPSVDSWCVGMPPCQDIPIATAECQDNWMYGMRGTTAGGSLDISGLAKGVSGRLGGNWSVNYTSSEGLYVACYKRWMDGYQTCKGGVNSCGTTCERSRG